MGVNYPAHIAASGAVGGMDYFGEGFLFSLVSTAWSLTQTSQWVRARTGGYGRSKKLERLD